MQDNKSARAKMLSKLQKLGMKTHSMIIANATDEELSAILQGIERIRDNRLARFVVSLIQSSK